MIGKRTNPPTVEEQIKQAARTAFTAGYKAHGFSQADEIYQDKKLIEKFEKFIYKLFEEYWRKQNAK